MNRRLRKIWICNDIWLNILPLFDRAQLGLKLALISPHFDALVDKHFDCGKTELTLWNGITISKDTDEMPKAKLFVSWNLERVEFPLPKWPLPNKIRFKALNIKYIDRSVIKFVRSNKPIFDRKGTKLDLNVSSDNANDVQQIWDVFVREIWPFFAPNIRHLGFDNDDNLDNLRRLISPTILSHLDQLNSIQSFHLCPDLLAEDDDFDGPNATSAGQALAKWLHNPNKDGHPKLLRCCVKSDPPNLEWVNNFKEAFVRARTSVTYSVHFNLHVSTPIEPFELVNEWTNEKLTLNAKCDPSLVYCWLLKRFPNIIVGETAEAVQKQQQQKDGNLADNLNNVFFHFRGFKNSIGPLVSSRKQKVTKKCSRVPRGQAVTSSGMNE